MRGPDHAEQLRATFNKFKGEVSDIASAEKLQRTTTPKSPALIAIRASAKETTMSNELFNKAVHLSEKAQATSILFTSSSHGPPVAMSVS